MLPGFKILAVPRSSEGVNVNVRCTTASEALDTAIGCILSEVDPDPDSDPNPAAAGGSNEGERARED